MTELQHRQLYMEHHNKAADALKRFIADVSDRTSWEEYLSESKIANKHNGIANAMWTKYMKKLYGYAVRG